MMRSLSSAVAGLRSHQTKMDVIGNNIANVNTNAFKASRMTFSDVYYQTLNGGRAAQGARGGQNPTQIGYGSQVSTIDMYMTNGGGGYTGRPYDVYIDGDGFFAVRDADDMLHYTRLGNLTFDESGWLVDYAGNKVQGIKLDTSTHAITDPNNPSGTINVNGHYDGTTVAANNGNFWTESELISIKLEAVTLPAGNQNIRDYISNISIGSDGSITAVVNEDIRYMGQDFKANDPIYLGKVAVTTFANPYGLRELGQSYFDEASNSGAARFTEADSNGAGKTKAGYLEMANVELSQEFTDMITTQRGFQANTRIITVSDEMLQELVNLKR